MTTSAAPAGPGPRGWWTILGVILVVGFAIGWAGRAPGLAMLNDDARYVLLSRSIALGQYNDLELPGYPLHAQYPPAFPAFLAAVTFLSGPALVHGIFANLLVLALAAVLISLTLRDLGYPLLGLTAGAAISVNPALLELGGTLMADPLYILATAAFLWVLRDDRGLTRSRLAAALAFAGLGFLTRSIGLALIGSLVAVHLARMNRRTIIRSAGILAGCVAAWFGYTIWAGQDGLGHTYADDILHVVPDLFSLEWARHVAVTGRHYFARAATNQFGVPRIEGTILLSLAWGVMLLGFGLAAAGVLWKRWRALIWVVAAHLAILLAFPWGVDRYFTPLVPWIIVIVLLGATELGRRRGMRRPELAGIALAGLLVIVGGTTAVRRAVAQVACRAGDPATDLRCVEPATADFVRAIRYLNDSLPENVVVASAQPATIFVMTGRRGVPIERLKGTTEKVAPQGPVDLVLLSTISSNHDMFRALQSRCDQFEVVGPSTSSSILVRRRADGQDACGLLASYLDRYRESLR